MKKRFDKIIIPALITSLLLVCNSFLCQSANCENLNYFHSIVKHVQYGYTIQNKTAKAVKDARFMTYAPLAQTSGQYCSEIETAERIFRYITANVQSSGYSGKARGARYAFYNKRGDCTEFMYLFVALCRAAGIPSRGIGGYILSKSGKLTPSGYHNWAEFYHEGSWEIADPQRRLA